MTLDELLEALRSHLSVTGLPKLHLIAGVDELLGIGLDNVRVHHSMQEEREMGAAGQNMSRLTFGGRGQCHSAAELK